MRPEQGLSSNISPKALSARGNFCVQKRLAPPNTRNKDSKQNFFLELLEK